MKGQSVNRRRSRVVRHIVKEAWFDFVGITKTLIVEQPSRARKQVGYIKCARTLSNGKKGKRKQERMAASNKLRRREKNCGVGKPNAGNGYKCGRVWRNLGVGGDEHTTGSVISIFKNVGAEWRQREFSTATIYNGMMRGQKVPA